MGADIGTMPTSVFTQLLKHPLTDSGLKRFLEDWEKVKAQMAAKARARPAMPIYEYVCPGCGSRFEKLVRRFGEAVSCPSCASADVEKQLSVFAVAPPRRRRAFAGCGAGAVRPAARAAATRGPCGGGACGLPS